MYKIKKLAALKYMLLTMERDIGLDSLTEGHRDVYYAACLAANDCQTVHSEEVRQHPMLSTLPRSTFFRLLKELVSGGYLIPSGIFRSGQYTVVLKS